MASLFTKALWRYVLNQANDAQSFQMIREKTLGLFPDMGPLVELFLTIKWFVFKGTPTKARVLAWLPRQVKRKWLQRLAEMDRMIRSRGVVEPGADAPPMVREDRVDEIDDTPDVEHDLQAAIDEDPDDDDEDGTDDGDDYRNAGRRE